MRLTLWNAKVTFPESKTKEICIRPRKKTCSFHLISMRCNMFSIILVDRQYEHNAELITLNAAIGTGWSIVSGVLTCNCEEHESGLHQILVPLSTRSRIVPLQYNRSKMYLNCVERESTVDVIIPDLERFLRLLTRLGYSAKLGCNTGCDWQPRWLSRAK